MMMWCFCYDVVKTIVLVDLNTDISNMVEHMEEIMLNLGLRELVSLFEIENISPDRAVIMKLRTKCIQYGNSKPDTLNVAGRLPTFLIPKETIETLNLTLLQICQHSNSSKLSYKNEEDQIENEGARLFTRFLPL